MLIYTRSITKEIKYTFEAKDKKKRSIEQSVEDGSILLLRTNSKTDFVKVYMMIKTI
jgi:hypothetical protein